MADSSSPCEHTLIVSCFFPAESHQKLETFSANSFIHSKASCFYICIATALGNDIIIKLFVILDSGYDWSHIICDSWLLT